MTCISLHNVCIQSNDPCQARWRLEVKDLSLIRENSDAQAKDASTTRDAIAEWLWSIREEWNAAMRRLTLDKITLYKTYMF